MDADLEPTRTYSRRVLSETLFFPPLHNLPPSDNFR